MSGSRIIGVCFIDTIRRGALNGNGGVNAADVTSFSSVNQVGGGKQLGEAIGQADKAKQWNKVRIIGQA